VSASDDSPRPGSDTWIAAIHVSEDDRRPVGSGFLIDGRRVLTCAHVVFDDEQQLRPELWVAFPKAHGLGYQRIRVQEVDAPPATRRDVEDVAVLVLAQPVADGYAARLRQPEVGSLVRHRWWAFGFPDGMLGNSSHGVIGEELGYGWIRLDTDSRHGVKFGYSGTALWSADYQAVIAMVGQAQGASGDARAITVRAIADCLPGQKLHALAGWSAEAAGESALAAWGWSLGTDPEAGRHWRPRARGVNTDSERGYRFRGRTAALTEIRDWLAQTHMRAQVLVVTGSPGVGKSAVLGRIVTTSTPAIAAALPPGDSAVRAVVGSVACAVHAKGKTALEVAGEIARAASARLPVYVTDLASDLQAAFERTDRRGFTVVIDALDEAANSQHTRDIIHLIARPLAEDLHHLGVRVVVGTRRQDDAGPLLEAFDTSHIIDLDTPRYFTQADLTAYALATLQLHGDERPDNPYNSLDIAEPVAQKIAWLADRNFLVAGLTARAHGMHDQQPVDTELLDFTPTVDAALASYLALLPGVDNVPAAVLMTALAYVEAPGMPISLWQTTITALGHIAPSPSGLQAFARSSAANFLIETSASDQPTPLYRLFHQALNDALLRHRDAIADEKAITLALLHAGQRLGWERAPAYLLRSLSGHAQRGGALDDLLADDTYPLYTDLRRLIPAAAAASAPAARRRARLLRITPRAIDAPPTERATLYSISEAIHGLGTTYRSLARDSLYRARWAATQQSNEETVLEGHGAPVSALCTVVLPDGGSLLASASYDNTVRLWDPVTGTLQHVLEGHTGPLSALCTVVLPDGGSLLASASYDKTVRLWDPVTGTLQHVLEGHTGSVSALCLVGLPDGGALLASASHDSTVRLWNPVTGTLQHILKGHTKKVRALCLVGLPDGGALLASASHDNTVRLWNPVTGTLQRVLKAAFDRGWRRLLYTLLFGDEGALCPVQLFDGRTLLATTSSFGSRTIRLWDPATGIQQRVLKDDTSWSWELCTVELPDGQVLLASASSSEGTIRLWDPATGTQQHVLHGHTGWMMKLCAVELPDGRSLLASASKDKTVRLWDPATGTSQHVLEGHGGSVRAMCTVGLPDGRILFASASDDSTVRLWDLVASSRDEDRSKQHASSVSALCTVGLPDGRILLAAASDDRRIVLWDPVTGTSQHVLTGYAKAVIALCTVGLPDGRILLAAASDDRRIVLWDPVTGTSHHILKDHAKPVRALCTVGLPDGGSLLASASYDKTVRLWDPVTGTSQHVLKGHTNDVRALCTVELSGGRFLLASASHDETVRLWDPVTGTLQHVLEGHTGPLSALCTVGLPDGGSLLASASYDNTVRLWDPVTGTLQHVLEGHTGPLSALCTVGSLDGGSLLASASYDKTVRLWDPVTGTLQHVLEGHTGSVSALCTVALSDGRSLLASASDDNTVRLWDYEGSLKAQIPVGGPPKALLGLGALVIALEHGILVVDIEGAR
jgi:WD40 repeat protein